MTDDADYDCTCYECIGSITVRDDDGHTYTWNNLKYHTLGEPCEQCGEPKSEYRDLGTKGYYTCWYCDGDGYREDPDDYTPPSIPDPYSDLGDFVEYILGLEREADAIRRTNTHASPDDIVLALARLDRELHADIYDDL